MKTNTEILRISVKKNYRPDSFANRTITKKNKKKTLSKNESGKKRT